MSFSFQWPHLVVVPVPIVLHESDIMFSFTQLHFYRFFPICYLGFAFLVIFYFGPYLRAFLGIMFYFFLGFLSKSKHFLLFSFMAIPSTTVRYKSWS